MDLLTLEDDKFKNVKIDEYTFKIRYISPLDRRNITNKRITLQAGNSIDSFTESEFLFFENVAIVDVCAEFPDKFKQGESCINWPDINLINELANEIKKHTNDIESLLKKNRPVS